MRKIDYLCYLIVVLTFISGVVGVFCTTGGERFFVTNIYGESIELYGDGIYKYNSVLKAGANKGTDFVMLIVAALFAIVTSMSKNAAKYRFLQVGLLSGLTYYSSILVFGVTFNPLFPVYVLLFSATLFAMVFLLDRLIRDEEISEILNGKSLNGTASFLLLSGSSVLVWLQFIIPALLAGQPLANIEIYTTEPTFVIDLAIILPTYLGCGIALFRKKVIAYKLTPILLTFITVVGCTVIGQSIAQSLMGFDFPARELIGLVFSFIVLGTVASFLNARILQCVN